MNTAVAPERWEGQIINGKFPLLLWLGGTGRTSVFSTEIPGLKAQKAAIKLIPADGTSSDQISHWQTAATLSHPNLLKIFDGGACEINARPMLYVVMELAEEDLSQVLPSRALSSHEADQMLAPVLDALFAHLGRARIDARARQIGLGGGVRQRPGARVRVGRLAGGFVLAFDDAEERGEQRELATIDRLYVRVDVPPLGG